ncbi:MAG: VanZ family protein [Oscillospiraceae bacterium]|nr:VanZ family protein [Oscillospiraceae bacterium]
MIRTKKRLALCTALIAVNLMLIWGNSLLPGTDSGAMSGGVVNFLVQLLDIPASYGDTVHTLIRKMAHFTEFACLGALLCWRFGMAGEQGAKLAYLPVLWGMAVALTDESIQLFTPDRGPSLADVWIDTCGAAAGMILVLIGYHFIQKKCKKNLEETT